MYFNHPSQGNSVNYYIILGPRDKAAPPTSQQIGQFPPKRVKYRHRHPFLFFISSSSTVELSLLAIRGKVRRTGRIFPEHVERSFLGPEDSFVAVGRITRTISAKQKFAQLRTNYIRRILPDMFANKMFAQLRTGLSFDVWTSLPPVSATVSYVIAPKTDQ